MAKALVVGSCLNSISAVAASTTDSKTVGCARIHRGRVARNARGAMSGDRRACFNNVASSDTGYPGGTRSSMMVTSLWEV